MQKSKLTNLSKWLMVSLSLGLISQNALSYEQDKTYQLTVLHTNDHHGHFWPNENGEYGLLARHSLINSIKAEVMQNGGSVLLLDAGDINTGVPESDVLHAEPDIKGMNLIGYEAMTIGNHEFDNPIEVLRQQEEWAEFPFLSANIYVKGTDNRLFKPYELFDKQGLKIAVVGLTTDDTAKVGNPEYVGNYEFRNPVEEAKSVIETLQTTDKPDVIIAASHLGYYADEQHGSNAPGDVTLARSLPEGAFDLIVGGHSHDAVCMASDNALDVDHQPNKTCQPDFQNGTWIVQALDLGKFVGRADFEFKNGELKLVNYQLIPVNLKEKIKNAQGESEYQPIGPQISPTKAMSELLIPFQAKGEGELMVKIGSVDEKLEGEREVVRFQQTNLAQLLLKAQMDRTQADLAVMGGGGVRASIDAGDITYKDVLTVQPFGNIVTYVDLTGIELEEYLAVVAAKKTDSGAYAQFANVSLNTDGTKVWDVKIKGEPLEAEKTYRLATLSFHASGGDGYPQIDKHKNFVNTGFVDAEVLKAYIEKRSPIVAKEYEPVADQIRNIAQ